MSRVQTIRTQPLSLAAIEREYKANRSRLDRIDRIATVIGGSLAILALIWAIAARF